MEEKFTSRFGQRRKFDLSAFRDVVFSDMKKYIPLAILIALSLHFQKSYYKFQWTVGLMALSCVAGYYIYKKTSPFLGAFVAYILSFSAFISTSDTGLYSKINEFDRLNFSTVALSASLGIILLFFVLTNIKKEHLNLLVGAIPLYGVINAIYVITNYILHIKLNGSMGFSGYVDNSSTNSNLIAYSMVYIACSKMNKAWLVPCAIAIMLSRSSIAYGILAVGVVSYLFSEEVFKKEVFLKCALAFVGIIALGFISEGTELFDSAGRFDAYSMYLSHWHVNFSNVFGTGPGSFMILSENIARAYNFMGGKWWYPWLHSDWLQTLFEGGWISFTLLVGAFLELGYKLYRARRSLHLSLLMAVSSSAIFNYPVRYFPGAMVCALIIAASYSVIEDDSAHRSKEI